MTETLPAVREPTQLDDYARLGQWLALSEADDKTEKGRGASAALRLYYVAQLKLPPTAAAELSVIGGRLSVGAQLLRAMANRHGYRVLRMNGSNDETCTAQLIDRNGVILGETTFTIEDAKKARLTEKTNWKTYPARMLWARASKNVIVDFAPEVALGIVLDDEVDELRANIQPSNNPPADPDDEDISWPEPVTPEEEADTLAELAALAEAEGDE